MEKTYFYEERPDYLRAMFENYFRFAKLNHCKIPFELFADGISAGLSGANYPEVNRDELLQSLIDNCQQIKEAAKRTLELRQPGIISVKKAEEPETAKEVRQKGFLNLDEVCEQFGLPKSNIKSKVWRDKYDFPYIQTGDKSKVTYKTCDVEKWVMQQQFH